MRTSIAFVCILLFTSLKSSALSAHPDDVESVPSGVRYTPVDGAEFRALTDGFIRCVRDPTCTINSARIMTIGPRLTLELASDPGFALIPGTLNVTMPVQVDGITMALSMVGRFAQTAEEGAHALAAIRAEWDSEEHIVARRANDNELRLYWAMIPYDISDPLFVVQTGSSAILIQLDPSGNLFWIDDVTLDLRAYVDAVCAVDGVCTWQADPAVCSSSIERLQLCVSETCSDPEAAQTNSFDTTMCGTLTEATATMRQLPCTREVVGALRRLTESEECVQVAKALREFVVPRSASDDSM
jgi:hypothetical protein